MLLVEIGLALFAGLARGWGKAAALPIMVPFFIGFLVAATTPNQNERQQYFQMMANLDIGVLILYIVMCIVPKSLIFKQEKTNEPAQLNKLTNDKSDDQLFCEIAVDLGFVQQELANKTLEEQKVDKATGENKPIGQYLFQKGLISKEQIGQIIKIQEKFGSK